MIRWYAVAYDVAGGVDWQGPMRWARARKIVQRFEESPYVARAMVCAAPPGINRRYLLRNCQ
jgi:hypothetical protein